MSAGRVRENALYYGWFEIIGQTPPDSRVRNIWKLSVTKL